MSSSRSPRKSSPARGGATRGRPKAGAKPGRKPGGKPPGRKPSGPKGSGPKRSGGKGRAPKSAGGRSDAKPATGRRVREPLRPDEGGPKRWGSLARKGTRNLSDDERFIPETEKREEARRAAAAAHRDVELTPEQQAERDEKRAQRAERQAQRDARTKELRSEAREAIGRAKQPKPKTRRPARNSDRKPMPKVPLALAEPEVAFAKAVGAKRAGRLLRSLENASQQFAAERFTDANRSLRPAIESAPEVAEVRELQGLIDYRLGKWKPASRNLEAFRELTGTTEQHPVLADCYRALGRHDDVQDLWAELRSASPNAALVVEGRIVTAGSLADQDKLDDAIELLEAGWNRPKKPRPHHLRRAYALADLYDRSGQGPRARALFSWVAGREPDFADAAARAAD